MDAEWIDSEEFPFTVAEVYLAARIWNVPSEAQRLTESIAREFRRFADSRSEAKDRADAASREGVHFVSGQIGDFTSHQGWLWPTLSVLSRSCEMRVSDAMATHWRRRAEQSILEQQVKFARETGLIPTHEEFAAVAANPEKMRALYAEVVRRMPVLPPATDEMRRAAQDVLAVEKRDWSALAAEAKSRFDSTPSASPRASSPDPEPDKSQG
jgi:hypothetical protein